MKVAWGHKRIRGLGDHKKTLHINRVNVDTEVEILLSLLTDSRLRTEFISEHL